MMKHLMERLFYSCEEATRLIERSREERVSVQQKARLAMHKGMCRLCRNYDRLSRSMETWLKRWSERSVPKGEQGLPPEKKEAILEKLRREG